MSHRVYKRTLHRNRKLRKQLFKVLTYNFVSNGKLITTEGRAKSFRSIIEKLVTKAKKGEANRNLLLAEVGNKNIVNKLFEVAKIFKDTPGGYVKLIKMETRIGDNSRQLLMVWSKENTAVAPVEKSDVEVGEVVEEVKPKRKTKSK